MAAKENTGKPKAGDKRDAARRKEWRGGKLIRRAQAIVGIRTPGTSRKQGLSEAAERKARRELPYVEDPEGDEPPAPDGPEEDEEEPGADL